MAPVSLFQLRGPCPRGLASLAVAGALLLCAGFARATDTYPEFIQDELGLAAAPECTLCHLTNDGQENTVRRPFGLQVLSHDGTGGGSRGSIRSALKAMDDDGSDSDGDGFADIEELRGGGDPNVFDARDGGAIEPPAPIALPPAFETGCAVAPGAPVTNSGRLSAIAFLIAALRLSRRETDRRAPGWPGGAVKWNRSDFAGEASMSSRITGIVCITAAVATAAISASAALHTTDGSSVSFDAVGPAGMKIHGKSRGPVQLAEKGESFEFTSPTNAFVTGLDLRDSHLKKYLNVDKHPKATLVVQKAQVKVPAGSPVASTATGAFTLNGVTKPVKVTYKVSPSGKAYDVEASFAVNLPDFGIEQPCYLGVCVQNTVKVAVALVARED